MREIKFRLRYDNAIVGYEKWYRGSYDGDFCNAKPQWLYSEDGEYWNPDYISHRHKDEFTGLKDKNGKEIYEGDIVQSGGAFRDEKIVEKVEWESSLTGFFPFNNYDGDCQVYYDMASCEIIGNIYSNPELLK